MARPVYNADIRDYLAKMSNDKINELLDDEQFLQQLGDDGSKELMFSMLDRGLPAPRSGILRQRFLAYCGETEETIQEIIDIEMDADGKLRILDGAHRIKKWLH